LPGHGQMERKEGAVCAAPYGSASILPITWMYIRMMGGAGLKRASQLAILNANYISRRLEEHYPVLYTGSNGLVAHECILDLRPLKDSSGISVDDVAKRLIDFGFHAPTMSFPVPGTLMVEPTESEPRAELDRFCEAMLAIRDEVAEVEAGHVDAAASALRHAPHTAEAVGSDVWDRAYPRSQGAWPASQGSPESPAGHPKYWVPVARIDNAYGDKNLVCTCPPMEELAGE
ncbi:MAG: glycine dehydrogenase (aminomethyl-transferring), partial [Acidimicrobiales bacterium]